MKSLLGLKAKAEKAVQDQFDRVSQTRQKPSFGLTPAQQSELSFDGPTKPTSRVEQADAGAVDPVIQHLLKNARSEAVRQEFLRMPSDDYTSKHDVNVLVGTYNVNGRRPPAELDLRPWLDISSHQADVVAVGFQEVVPLNATSVVMGGGLEAGSVWDMHIDRALNNPLSSPADASKKDDKQESPKKDSQQRPRAGSAVSTQEELVNRTPSSARASGPSAANVFVQVAAKQMVGVYLSVWVRRGILQHVRGVQVTYVGTGMMGYLGNKGAVAVRLRAYDSGLCFICAHLASGEAEGDELKRNYDYSEIVRRGQFPQDTASLDPESDINGASSPAAVPQAAGDGRGPGQWGSQKGFLENEHCIWMGDLNYRLTIPDEKARALIREGDLEQLLLADELTIMLRDKRAFLGWTEGHITFQPTFKFKRGTSLYLGADDEDESEQAERPSPSSSPDKAQAAQKEKKRTPAWTDRILYKSPAGAAKQQHYSSASLLVSDHKPVTASLTLTVREFVRDVVEAAVDTARRTVDAREMAAMPRCELEPTSAEIGEAFYGQRKKVHLILRNTGQVTANFQFMPLPGVMFGDDADKKFRTAPRWATIEPEQGVLEPGSGQEVVLTVWIHGGLHSTAQLAACTQSCKLDGILVLRIQDGNDIFVSVAGKYQPSFFGIGFQCLANLPRPLIQSTDELEPQDSGLRVSTGKDAGQSAQADEGQEPTSASGFYSPTNSYGAASPAGISPRSEPSDSHLHSERHTHQRQSLDNQAQPSTYHEPQHSQQHDSAAHPTTSQAPDQASNSESPSAMSNVPPELRAITAYLKDKERLKTQGLFVNSADSVMLEAMHQPPDRTPGEGGSGAQGGRFAGVEKVRIALDKGQPIPDSATAHDVAATLLGFFASLPAPLMPPAVAQVCNVCVPTNSAAASLLADSLSPVEWAVFRHVSGLLQDALAPEVASANTLTASGLAALFAEVWFPSLAPGFGAAGQNLKPEDVAELQRVAANVDLVADMRAAFVSLFLDRVSQCF